MNENINKILEDLYKIDASFRAHEAEIIKIINKVLESRPKVRLDDNFVALLRQKVMAKAEAIAPQGGNAGLFNFMQFNKLAYAGIGAIIMLVIILPAMWLTRQSANQPIAMNDSGLSAPAKIARLENNAFGLLLSSGQNQESLAAGAPVDGRGAGGGGGDAVAMETLDRAGGGAEGKMIMPAPDLVNYRYEYAGGEISLAESTIPVYRRIPDNALGKRLAGTLGNIDLGLVNTGKFSDLEVMNLSIAEDREFGYMVYFNFSDSSLSINSNWEKWPQVGTECRDEACFEQYRLQESDVPSDSRLIAIAEDFLAEYGISLENYGEPYVNDYWRRNYVVSGENSYVPDSLSVVFPQNIEGKTTYDESGNASGLTVDVSIRHNRVANVYGIFKPDFSRSDYQAETDAARILKFAENGGLWPSYQYPDAQKTVVLELGTPTRGLVRHWHYVPEQEKGSSELFVEALFFPIVNLEELEEPYYRQYVVIPLAKEILDSSASEPIIGIPEPMPLIRADDAAGAAVRTEEMQPDAPPAD